MTMPLYDLECTNGHCQVDVWLVWDQDPGTCTRCGAPLSRLPQFRENCFKPFLHTNIDPHKDVWIDSKKQLKEEAAKRGMQSHHLD